MNINFDLLYKNKKMNSYEYFLNFTFVTICDC